MVSDFVVYITIFLIIVLIILISINLWYSVATFNDCETLKNTTSDIVVTVNKNQEMLNDINVKIPSYYPEPRPCPPRPCPEPCPPRHCDYPPEPRPCH